MENIIINFQTETAGLDTASQKLEQVEQADKAVADQAKKTQTEWSKQSKAFDDQTKKNIDSLGKFANGFKNLDKSIVGGAYKKALGDLAKQVDGMDDKFAALAVTVDFAKQRLAQLDTNSEEFKTLSEEINIAEEALKQLGTTEEQTEGKTKSMKARLRELKQELQQMEDAGDDSSEAFIQLSTEAGKLEDQIGDTNARIRALASDTANLDAVVGSLNLLASGFGLAAAGQSLFGDENEDLQKALVKLNAIMVATNSLREIQNALQAQSIVRIKAESIGQGLLAAANRVTAVSMTTLGVSVNTTSTAFKLLRGAIAATGIGLAVIAIVAIVQAVNDWSDASAKAAERQKALAEATKDLNEAIAEQNSEYEKFLSGQTQAIQKQLELAQASGSSQLRQLELRAQIAQQDKANAERVLKNLGLTEVGVQRLGVQYDVLQGKIINANQTLKNAIESNASKETIEGTKQAIEQLNGELAALKPLYDAGTTAVQNLTNAQQQLTTTSAETSEFLNQAALKSATAFSDARVLLAKIGTKEELDARIDAIRTAAREELANVNLTAGERAKIEANVQRQIRDLRFEYEKRQLEDAKRAVDARALRAQEGTRLELDYRLQQSRLAEQIELKDQELTANKRLEIEARFQKERTELIMQYQQKVAEDALNSRISDQQARLADLELSLDAATNAKLLEAKQVLIDQQAALEVIGIEYSEKNEELRRAKINAVYAKALADKQALERAKIQAEIQADLQEQQSIQTREQAKATIVLQNQRSTEAEKRKAEEDAFRARQAAIAAEEFANNSSLTRGLITLAEYRQKQRDLETQQDQLDLDRQNAHWARITRVRELAQQTAINLANAVFATSKANLQAEEANVKKLYDEKKITEDEYNNRLKTIRRKQANDEKAQAIFTTLVQQGPTVLKGFQQGGFAGVAAAFALFFSLLQSVQSAQVPQFAKGVIDLQGPGTETSDSIPARLSKGESVMTAAETRKYREALTAMRENRFDQYLSQVAVPDTIAPTAVAIDYDKLASLLGEKIAGLPTPGVSFDERGFVGYVEKYGQRTEYLNKKLTL